MHGLPHFHAFVPSQVDGSGDRKISDFGLQFFSRHWPELLLTLDIIPIVLFGGVDFVVFLGTGQGSFRSLGFC
jgi:hypothetical protein